MKARAYDLVSAVTELSEEEQARRQEEQIMRLGFLVRELRRLLQTPQLFPSAAVRARFFAMLGVDSRLRFGEACKDLLLKAELCKIMRSARKNQTRKLYREDCRAWDNFLLNGAPGTPFEIIPTLPKSAFQVIPAAGMRIVTDFEREESEIVRWVEQVSPHDMSMTSQIANTNTTRLKYP